MRLGKRSIAITSTCVLAGALSVAAGPVLSPLLNGLVAAYPFVGSAKDYSGNSNHGIPDDPVLVADRFGRPANAYQFNGVDDQISVADDATLDIQRGLSIALWMNPSQQKTQYMVVKGPGVNGPTSAPYTLALSATGTIVFHLRDENLTIASLVLPGYLVGGWSFVTATWDGRAMSLYVDGQLKVAKKFVLGNLNENDAPLLIGTRLRLPADTFAGTLDDIVIYDRPLSTKEIQKLYVNGIQVP